MQDIYYKLNFDLSDSRLEPRNKVKTNALRTLVGDLQTIEKRNQKVTDEVCIATIKKHLDGIKESIGAYSEMGYVYNDTKILELQVQKEVLENYLPTQMNADDIAYIMEQHFGNEGPHISEVFKYFKENFAGRFDGKLVKEVYKSVYSN